MARRSCTVVRPRSHLELEFSPPLAVGDGGNQCHRARGSHPVVPGPVQGIWWNPATANAGGSNASLVADNIRQSFRAFRDDRRDGDAHGDG